MYVESLISPYRPYRRDNRSLRRRNLTRRERPWLQNTTIIPSREELISIAPLFNRFNIPVPQPVPQPVPPGGGSYVQYYSDTPTSGPSSTVSFAYQVPYAAFPLFPSSQWLTDLQCTRFLSITYNVTFPGIYKFNETVNFHWRLGSSMASPIIFSLGPVPGFTLYSGSITLRLLLSKKTPRTISFTLSDPTGIFNQYPIVLSDPISYTPASYECPRFFLTAYTSGGKLSNVSTMYLTSIDGFHL
jgi:hypothetical protein